MTEMIPSKEREPKGSNGFPEPAAYFVYPGEGLDQPEVKFLTLGEIESKIAEVKKKLGKLEKDSVGPIPRRKHDGTPVSRRERRDIRTVRIRQKGRERQDEGSKLRRRLHLLERKEKVIFFSDPKDPLTIKIKSNDGTEFTGKQQLSKEEAAWKKHLWETRQTNFWSDPNVSLARHFFVLKLAVFQAATPGLKQEAESNLEVFRKREVSRIPDNLVPLFQSIAKAFEEK